MSLISYPLSGDIRPKYSWASFARGLGIILVVFGNALQSLDNFDIPIPIALSWAKSFIYSFHMPLFFFISGLFIEGTLSKGPDYFLKSKVGKLLWPFLLWTSAYHLILTGVPSYATLLDQLRATLTHAALYEHLWFLLVLFFTVVLYANLRWAGLRPLSIFAASLLVRVALKFLGVGRQRVFLRVLYALPYVALGNCSAATIDDWFKRKRFMKLAVLAAGLLALVAFAVTADWQRLGLVSFITAMFGVGGLLALARCLEAFHQARWLRFLGSISLIVYVLHPLIIDRVFIACRYLSLPLPNLKVVLLASLLGLYLPVQVFYLIDKFKLGWLFQLKFD